MSSSTGKKGKTEEKYRQSLFCYNETKAHCALGALYRPSQET